jgi:hypothetical protein
MIRPFTLITMLLAAGSGAYLFAVKHRAQVLDDQLASVDSKAQQDAQRITVLQAQWALETDPTRLAALAKQFSPLQPMKPVQLVTLASLRATLPQPNTALPAGAAPVPVPAPALVASAAPAAPVSGLPMPPPEAPGPAMVASAAPKITHPAPRPVSHSALHMADTRLAQDLPAPRALSATPRAVPRTVSHAPAPLGAQYVAMKAAPAAATPASVDSGSVLGMAADLAPPQPLPQSLGN